MADECDFCSSPDVVRRYECMDFDAESKDAGVLYDGTKTTIGPTNLVLHSTNYWAACANCERFIEADDIDGLRDRSVYRAGQSFFAGAGNPHAPHLPAIFQEPDTSS